LEVTVERSTYWTDQSVVPGAEEKMWQAFSSLANQRPQQFQAQVSPGFKHEVI
jgi:hypothetical protein